MPIQRKNNLPFVAAAIVIVGVLLAIFFWVVPHSILGWLDLLIVGIPAWLFLEWLGEVALGMPFFQRLSSPVRILIGIPLVIVLMAVALLIALFVQDLVLVL